MILRIRVPVMSSPTAECAPLALMCRHRHATVLDWAADVGNEASRKSAEAMRFQMEGLTRMRSLRLSDGVRRDEWVGGLLKSAGPARLEPRPSGPVSPSSDARSLPLSARAHADKGK